MDCSHALALLEFPAAPWDSLGMHTFTFSLIPAIFQGPGCEYFLILIFPAIVCWFLSCWSITSLKFWPKIPWEPWKSLEDSRENQLR